MNEMIFEVVKVVLMLAIAAWMLCLFPWIRQKMGSEKMEAVERWVKAAVLATQQTCQAKTGAERKEIVMEILRTFLLERNIEISNSQLDVLIEAAVKTMKMAEGKITA